MQQPLPDGMRQKREDNDVSQVFGNAVHAAFVVPDLDYEIERVLATGIGPIFLMKEIRPLARYRGERNDLFMSAAFVFSGNMVFEYVQQHDNTPSAYKEFLDRHPEGGLHHYAYFCDTFQDARDTARKLGKEFTVVQEYIWPSGEPYEIYMEPEGHPDPLLVQLMIHSPLEQMFEEMERISQDWDGSKPIRNAFELLPESMRAEVEQH